VTPPDRDGTYKAPTHEFGNVDGCVHALLSPNLATRYIAWTALHAMGDAPEPVLVKVFQESNNPQHRARALWLLGKMPGRGAKYVNIAASDKDANIRMTAIRLVRQLDEDVIAVARKLVRDPSPQVRREVAIALRHNSAPSAAELWAELALQHNGKDRWYLEALGISADGQWDTFLSAWLKKVGTDWNNTAGLDVVWRSRAKATPALLAKIITDASTPPEKQPRYFRAFDFLSGPEKDEALKSILGQ
jgi:hypothetical protein